MGNAMYQLKPKTDNAIVMRNWVATNNGTSNSLGANYNQAFLATYRFLGKDLANNNVNFLPGQNVRNPLSKFYQHVVVMNPFTGQFDDPSYAQSYGSVADFEANVAFLGKYALFANNKVSTTLVYRQDDGNSLVSVPMAF